MIKGYAPLSDNLNFWPSFFGDAPPWLDDVGFINYEIYENETHREVSGQLAILTRIAFPFFGIPNMELVFLNGGNITILDFRATTLPGFSLDLTNLNVSLLIKNDWLVPVELVGSEWLPIMDGANIKPFAVTLGGAGVSYSLPDDLVFDASGLSATIDAVELGNTGIVIEMTGITPYLSSQQTPPEGHPHFKGVGINNITVHLPFDIDQGSSTGTLEGNNILIGNTGFSGEIRLASGGSPLLQATLGDFSVGLNCFSLTFYQNAIVGSEICGKMQIPGFQNASGNPAEVDVNVHFDEDGDFYISVSDEQGLQDLKIPNILTLKLDSLSVGKRDGRFFVAVSGNLDFDQQSGAIGQFLPQDVEITKMLIWSDGTFEFEGGALVLPKAITLPIGPVKLSITALHLGSDERNGVKYKYVGFDGGLSINPAGVDARGDGIKYYFTEDGSSHFFRIEGIGIDLALPGNVSEDKAALLLSGYLAVKEGGTNGVEYAGNVAFSLPRMNIAGSAGMRYMPDVPAFLVNVGLEISNPIPLGSTGLGIYGFEALFGRHFVVSKAQAGLSDDTPWFEYYKMPTRGINEPKFYPIGGTSLGAGVLFGTAADSGFTFSSRLFFLLSLPGVFFLEGEAQLLKKRIGFASQNTPPFYAFLAITDSSIEAALGVDYKVPDSGSQRGAIAEVTGAMELGFFFGNSTGWYVNIGRDLPENKRIQAKLLRIINRAYFYLMLSASGIRTGAGAGMKIDKKFGPARVKVEAYLDLAGRLSFRPLQVGGSIRAGIEGSVSIFGVGIGIGAHFALSVDAPKPFIIAGEVKVCVKLLFIKKCAKVKFKWNFNNSLNVVQIPLLQSDSVNAINVHTGESYPVAFNSNPSDTNVIPLDSYVDIEFKHAVNPLPTTNDVGGIGVTPKYRELLPPKKAKAPQLTYEFEVTNVTLSPNDIYNIPGATGLPADPKIGFWQWSAPGHYTKIRLLSLSPLSFMSSGVPNGPSWSEDYAVLNLNCVGTLIDETCVDLTLVGASGLLPSQTLFTTQNVGFELSDGPAGTINSSAIRFHPGQALTLYLAVPTALVRLGVQTGTTNLQIDYYRLEADANLNYSDVLVSSQNLAGASTPQELLYNDDSQPIQKIVIRSGYCEGGGIAGSGGLPCTQEIMADLVGIINGFFKAGGLPDEPYEITHPLWLSLIYKYLVGNTFNICKQPKRCSRTDSLRNDIKNSLPDVYMIFTRLSNYIGEYSFEVPGCVKYTLKFLLPVEYFGQVSCFECLKFPGPLQDGRFFFSVQAVLQDGTTRVPFQGCITVEYLDGSGYGETNECYSELRKLCYLSLEDFQLNDTVTQANSANNTGDEVNALNSSVGQVLWKPDQTYTVNVGTRTRVYKDGSTLLQTYTENHTVKFRTEGPPGFFHQFDNNNLHPLYSGLPAALQDKFKLRTLLHYIDFATSYPNADGNLINAKPIFYENVELGLFFKQAYVRTMYDSDWGGYRLGLKIKDPARPADNADVTFAQWVPGPVIETVENEVINTILNGVPCLGINTVQTVAQGSVFAKDLEPLKCYTAVYNAFKGSVEREVHRYTFETSRYASFTEQVNSYAITDEEGNTTEAVFVVEKDWSGVSIPSTNSEDVLAYEQVLFGTLGLSDLPPATTTEFLLLRNSANNSIIAALVRNPEPFNDPKIPVLTLEEGIDLQVNGTALTTKIVAKDSSAILFPGGGAFPGNGQVSITATFRYKRYNPDTGQYENVTTENVSFTKQF
ncbi:MAG: hypothetical protein AAGG75_19535 [Bacteroidota bacterium]